jgi:hypothetical protein
LSGSRRSSTFFGATTLFSRAFVKPPARLPSLRSAFSSLLLGEKKSYVKMRNLCFDSQAFSRSVEAGGPTVFGWML